jgi:hypothetical protein
MRKPSLLLAFAAAAFFSVAAAQSPRRRNTFPPPANTSNSQTDQSAWEGTYTFQEGGGRTAGGTGEFVEHTVVVRREGDTLIADLDADGFQTSRSLRCSVKAEGDKLSLYFQSYREDNIFTPYKKGQLLLTLERSMAGGRNKLLTYWGAYQPALNAARGGRVYFKKTK